MEKTSLALAGGPPLAELVPGHANGQKGAEGLGFPLLGAKSPGPKTAVANARDYLGMYPLTPAFAIEVTEPNGTLFAQATGQPKTPLFASAKDEFFYRVVDAQVSFTRDAGGQVVGLVLHQGGRGTPAKKSK